MATIEVGPESMARWERFRPFQYNAEDWQTLGSFKGVTNDTLTRRLRSLSLTQLVRHVARNGIKGKFAEAGCLHGQSANIIARTMTLCGIDEPLLLFDSFQGLPPATPEDFQIAANHVDTFNQQAALQARLTLFTADMEATKANLAEHSFIEFHPGWMPQTFVGLENERFAFVHVDVDLYEPVRDCLNFFYPRLAEGGVIQFDDYNFTDWPGAQRATDDYVAWAKPSVFFELPLGGAFLIK